MKIKGTFEVLDREGMTLSLVHLETAKRYKLTLAEKDKDVVIRTINSGTILRGLIESEGLEQIQ